MKIKLSIIIPVFNGQDVIDRCITSIGIQNAKEVEVILVDDGSVDATAKICKEMCVRYSNIRYIYQTNQGVSSARNTGIVNSKGTYITFIDIDDTVKPDYIRKILYALENKADLTIMQYEKIDRNDKIVPYKLKISNKEEPLNEVLFLFALLLSNEVWDKVYDRDLIISYNIRFDRTMKFAEDIYFNLDYVRLIKNVYVSDSVVYQYRDTPGSATDIRKIEYINDIGNLYVKLLDFIDQYHIEDMSNEYKAHDNLIAEIRKNYYNQQFDNDAYINCLIDKQIILRLVNYKSFGLANHLQILWLKLIKKKYYFLAEFCEKILNTLCK